MTWPYGVRTFRSHHGRAGPATPRGATTSCSTASTCRGRARRSTSTARSTVFAAGAAILCYMAISPAEAQTLTFDAGTSERSGRIGSKCETGDYASLENLAELNIAALSRDGKDRNWLPSAQSSNRSPTESGTGIYNAQISTTKPTYLPNLVRSDRAIPKIHRCSSSG